MKVQRLIMLDDFLNEMLKKEHLNVSELINTLLMDWKSKKEQQIQSNTEIISAKELEVRNKQQEIDVLKDIEQKKEAMLRLVPQNVVEWLLKWSEFHKDCPSMHEINNFRQTRGIKPHIITIDMFNKAWDILMQGVAVSNA